MYACACVVVRRQMVNMLTDEEEEEEATAAAALYWTVTFDTFSLQSNENKIQSERHCAFVSMQNRNNLNKIHRIAVVTN